MTSDLSVIATSRVWSPRSQVVTATDGLTRMALGVGVSLVVCNRTIVTFTCATYSLKIIFFVTSLRRFALRKIYTI